MRKRKVNPTPNELSAVEYQAMIYIEDHADKYHRAPEVRDIQAAIGLSIGGTHGVLLRLVDYGYLAYGRPRCKRNFTLRKSAQNPDMGYAPPAGDADESMGESILDQMRRLPVTLDGYDLIIITPRSALSDAEYDAMLFIEDYIDMMGRSPSVREVQEAIEFQSPSGTYDLLMRLVRSGWLYRDLFHTARNWHIRRSVLTR